MIIMRLKQLFYNGQPWPMYATFLNMAAACERSGQHGGAPGPEFPFTIMLFSEVDELAAPACCRSCSNLSWFCLFHLVLNKN